VIFIEPEVTVIDPLPAVERPASFEIFHVKLAVPWVLPVNLRLPIVEAVNGVVPVNALEPLYQVPYPEFVGVISTPANVPPFRLLRFVKSAAENVRVAPVLTDLDTFPVIVGADTPLTLILRITEPIGVE
jgi:hypothetical protein